MLGFRAWATGQGCGDEVAEAIKKRRRNSGGLDGRERLLAATREMLRAKPPASVPRKRRAAAAVLVPALVTYHFRNDADLIEAASRPVFDGYLDALEKERTSSNAPDVKFRTVVLLLLRVSRNDGLLLDRYLHYIKLYDVPHKSTILLAPYLALDAIIKECQDAGLFGPLNSAFLQTALWGVCRSVGGTPELVPLLTANGTDEENVAAAQADLIVTMFRNAFAPPPSSRERDT